MVGWQLVGGGLAGCWLVVGWLVGWLEEEMIPRVHSYPLQHVALRPRAAPRLAMRLCCRLVLWRRFTYLSRIRGIRGGIDVLGAARLGAKA